MKRTRMTTPKLALSAVGVALVAFTGLTGNAAIVFQEDFESPVVTGYAEGTTPSSWVGATEGYGAGRRGLINEDSGTFTDPTGEQAYAFRYTNSGITTDVGLIGALTAGETYTVNFDAVLDDTSDGYTVTLVTFTDGATRNDVRNNTGASSELARLSGGGLTSSYQSFSFDYTSDGTETALLGDDVAVRIYGASTSGNIDNVSVDVESTVIPEPASLLLLGLAGVGLASRRRRR